MGVDPPPPPSEVDCGEVLEEGSGVVELGGVVLDWGEVVELWGAVLDWGWVDEAGVLSGEIEEAE